MTEYHHSRKRFMLHFLKNLGLVIPLLGASLMMGIIGYHYTEGMAWIDALLNAAMIMGGMGPVDALHTWEGKLFASLYALYSGLFLIAVTGFLLSPFFNRVLHKFHRDNQK